MSLSVVLVDDHILFRQGVKAFLDSVAHFKVSGEAGSGVDALALLEKMALDGGLPDVVVLDWVMPGAGGMETTRQLTQRYPKVCVIILSLYEEKSYMINALRSGAKGYILKDDTAEHLIKAIHAVTSGERYLSPFLHLDEKDLV